MKWEFEVETNFRYKDILKIIIIVYVIVLRKITSTQNLNFKIFERKKYTKCKNVNKIPDNTYRNEKLTINFFIIHREAGYSFTLVTT